ncbi:MAG: peptidylprolyl isomerase [Pyrinomonadaceae bacterium]
MNSGISKFGLVVLLAFGSTFAEAQVVSRPCLKKFGQREWTILVKDLDVQKKKQLLDDPEQRRTQADGIRQLLALACEAESLGITKEKLVALELTNIRSETIAVDYDRRFKKGADYVPFSRISDAQIAAFYSNPAKVAESEIFVNVKVETVQASNPDMAGRVITDDEKKEAKTLFAKIKISEKAAAVLGEPFRSAAELKVRMQQAQYLARLASESLANEISVSNAEVAEYIAEHPELDTSVKKVTAEKLLARAKAGEDFAKLADEFTQDPGNDREGKKNGGLYADVPVGVMVPSFEKAALALEPGQISPGLVESDFGYHVIKLEKKTADGQKYDVRHILIATTVKDPENPGGREVPATVWVRSKLETERDEALLDRIVFENQIVVEDYKPVTAAAAPPKRVVKKRLK